MKDFEKPTVFPVHLQLFRPSVIRGPCLDLFGPGWWFVSKTSNDSGMKRVSWVKHSWTHVRLIIQHLFVMACRNFSVRSAQFCGLTLTTKWVTFLSIAFFSFKSNFLMKFLYITLSLFVFRPEQTSTISSLSFDGICNNEDGAESISVSGPSSYSSSSLGPLGKTSTESAKMYGS